jgi:hypothetical protein
MRGPRATYKMTHHASMLRHALANGGGSQPSAALRLSGMRARACLGSSWREKRRSLARARYLHAQLKDHRLPLLPKEDRETMVLTCHGCIERTDLALPTGLVLSEFLDSRIRGSARDTSTLLEHDTSEVPGGERGGKAGS